MEGRMPAIGLRRVEFCLVDDWLDVVLRQLYRLCSWASEHQSQGSGVAEIPGGQAGVIRPSLRLRHGSVWTPGAEALLVWPLTDDSSEHLRV